MVAPSTTAQARCLLRAAGLPANRRGRAPRDQPRCAPPATVRCPVDARVRPPSPCPRRLNAPQVHPCWTPQHFVTMRWSTPLAAPSPVPAAESWWVRWLRPAAGALPPRSLSPPRPSESPATGGQMPAAAPSASPGIRARRPRGPPRRPRTAGRDARRAWARRIVARISRDHITVPSRPAENHSASRPRSRVRAIVPTADRESARSPPRRPYPASSRRPCPACHPWCDATDSTGQSRR